MPISGEAARGLKPIGRQTARTWGYLLVLLVIVAVPLALWQILIPSWQRPVLDPKIVQTMARALESWGKHIPSDNDPNRDHQVVVTFFTFLSQKGCESDLKGGHPDAVFLRRLPTAPPTDLSTADQVSRAIINLRDRFAEKPPADRENTAKTRELAASPQVIGEIVAAMQYGDWWIRQCGNVRRGVDNEVAATVRAKALKFLRVTDTDKVNRSWQVPVADEMCTLLKKWEVRGITQEDAQTRPWFVFYSFFYILSQEPLKPDDMRADVWYALFAKRLPGAAVHGTGVLASEEQLVASLKVLGKRLGVQGSEQAAALTKAIGDAMDYDKWRAKFPQGLVPFEAEEGTPALNSFVSRFRTTKHR